jgi:hypothetical protein
MTFFLIFAASTLLLLFVRHFLADRPNATHSVNIINDETADAFIRLTPTELAERYKREQGLVKGGTLCFWGHWFGRPYDNFHQISSVDFDTTTNVLTICFSEHETLIVTNPADIREYKERLVIDKADKVYWQWYKYGKAQEPENLFYYDINTNDGSLNPRTNAHWHKGEWKDLTILNPAVLLT